MATTSPVPAMEVAWALHRALLALGFAWKLPGAHRAPARLRRATATPRSASPTKGRPRPGAARAPPAADPLGAVEQRYDSSWSVTTPPPGAGAWALTKPQAVGAYHVSRVVLPVVVSMT